jgi:hypothetical protein
MLFNGERERNVKGIIRYTRPKAGMAIVAVFFK